MTTRRIMVICEMHGHTLLRRRLTMLLLVALPLALYLSGHGYVRIEFGGLGLAWAIATVSLFTLQAGRTIDPFLALSGYRPFELLLGRLILLEGVGAALAVLFWVIMSLGEDPPRPATLLVALLVTAGIAVPMGIAIAALVPRELEGVLVLIGIVAVAMVMENNSVLHPLYGSREILNTAALAERDAGIGAATLHALGVASSLWAVSLVAWMTRVRLHLRPPSVAPKPAVASGSPVTTD